MSAKRFIEAVNNNKNDKLYRTCFTVNIREVPKPGNYLLQVFMLPSIPTIALDEEDIQYLYNKYKNKAELEDIEEREKQRMRRLKEIEEHSQKIIRLQEELKNQ